MSDHQVQPRIQRPPDHRDSTVLVHRDELHQLPDRVALAAIRTGRPVVRLTRGQATAHALRLHADGLSYAAIASVMDRYHGHPLSSGAWACRLKNAGAPRRRQRGAGLANLQDAA